MIGAECIISLIDALERKIGAIETKDTEGWTLEECDSIKLGLAALGNKASLLYLSCMTDEEMAELERRARDDG